MMPPPTLEPPLSPPEGEAEAEGEGEASTSSAPSREVREACSMPETEPRAPSWGRSIPDAGPIRRALDPPTVPPPTPPDAGSRPNEGDEAASERPQAGEAAANPPSEHESEAKEGA